MLIVFPIKKKEGLRKGMERLNPSRLTTMFVMMFWCSQEISIIILLFLLFNYHCFMYLTKTICWNCKVFQVAILFLALSL